MFPFLAAGSAAANACFPPADPPPSADLPAGAGWVGEDPDRRGPQHRLRSQTWQVDIIEQFNEKLMLKQEGSPLLIVRCAPVLTSLSPSTSSPLTPLSSSSLVAMSGSLPAAGAPVAVAVDRGLSLLLTSLACAGWCVYLLVRVSAFRLTCSPRRWSRSRIHSSARRPLSSSSTRIRRLLRSHTPRATMAQLLCPRALRFVGLLARRRFSLSRITQSLCGMCAPPPPPRRRPTAAPPPRTPP